MSRKSAILGAGLVVLTYVGTYVTFLDPEAWTYAPRGGAIQRVPSYRWGGQVAAFVFKPMELLDRFVRPDYWAPVTAPTVPTDDDPWSTPQIEVREVGHQDGA